MRAWLLIAICAACDQGKQPTPTPMPTPKPTPMAMPRATPLILVIEQQGSGANAVVLSLWGDGQVGRQFPSAHISPPRVADVTARVCKQLDALPKDISSPDYIFNGVNTSIYVECGGPEQRNFHWYGRGLAAYAAGQGAMPAGVEQLARDLMAIVAEAKLE